MVVDNMGLDHVAIKVRDIEQTIEFYTDVMNMAVSDRIGDSVAFLRTPAVADQAEHHEMNVTQYSDEELEILEERGELELDLHDFEEELPEDGPPMLPTTGPIYHIAFEVPDYNAITDTVEGLEERNHPIYRGPGRHGPGNNIFLYFPDPDGYPIELTAKMEEPIEVGGRPPKQWPESSETWNVWRKTDDLE